jgi:hypothetical protein
MARSSFGLGGPVQASTMGHISRLHHWQTAGPVTSPASQARAAARTPPIATKALACPAMPLSAAAFSSVPID